jgi:hypothetical protein
MKGGVNEMTRYAHRVVEEIYKRGVVPTPAKALVQLLCFEYGLEKKKASRLLANVLRELVKKGLVEKVGRGYYRAPPSLLPLPLPPPPSSPSSKIEPRVEAGGSGVEALREPRIICLRRRDSEYPFVTCNDPEGVVKHLMAKFKVEDLLAKFVLCAYVDWLSGLYRLYPSRTLLGILDYHRDIIEELRKMTVFVESVEELERLLGKKEAPQSASASSASATSAEASS